MFNLLLHQNLLQLKELRLNDFNQRKIQEEIQLKEIKSNNAKMVLEFETKIKEMELKYSTQINSEQLRADADLDKILLSIRTLTILYLLSQQITHLQNQQINYHKK